jgi:hypothetical protein
MKFNIPNATHRPSSRGSLDSTRDRLRPWRSRRDCFVALGGLGLLAMTIFLIAPQAALANGFASFDQRIEISRASILTIEEKIVVDFVSARHGIYRDLPVKYRTVAGNPFALRVKILSVTDADGKQLPYQIGPKGEYLRVKIGDPQATVIGHQSYSIAYSVSRALLYLDRSDELYWNAIVGEWGDLGLPARTAVTVVLPQKISASEIKTRCFTFVGSSDDGGCRGVVGADGAISFAASGTSLTVVIDWPKGIVIPPTAAQAAREWLVDNWIVFWPIIIFAGMFALWYKKGRDPKPSGPLVVQYEPPEAAAPAEIGALIKQTTQTGDIMATIVHLAVKGYVNIIESEERGLIGTSRVYSFELKKTWAKDASLVDFEQEILEGIFGTDATAGDKVAVSELKGKFYRTAAAAKKEVGEAVARRGWFAKNPGTVRAVYMGGGLAYVVFGYFFLYGLLVSVLGMAGTTFGICLLLPGPIIAAFGYFMPARTFAGTAAYAKALGFKEYLSKAEKYRLKWEEKENIFQVFLPYAMAFGVVDKWAKAFEGIEMQPPSWYHGTMMHGWSPIIFASSLNEAASSIGNALAVSPSSKGGGGMGGGGFGGGGFGGGGGGSW